MRKRNRLIKMILMFSMLCGCSTVGTHDELILRQNVLDMKTLTTQTIVETKEIGTMPAMIYADYEEGMDGIYWIASYVEGKLATVTQEYMVTTDSDGNEIAKTPVIGSRVETEAIPPKMQFGGSVSVGSEFYPTMLTYGVDCVGCNMWGEGFGGTSAGITVGLHSVRQPNGAMKDGITYGGYYIVAADPSIPLCSILSISNHGFSGEGLSPDVPFKAIVLDRGGGIRGNVLDLFKGSQSNYNISNNRHANTKVVIERVGGRDGKNACKL